MKLEKDQIIISQLNVSAFIGVTPEERKNSQRLRVSIMMEPIRGLKNLEDRIESTVDYFTVCNVIKALALQGERQLIETLAEDIAKELLEGFPLAAVEIELRKYILPDTEYVAVRIRREVQS